MKFIKNIANKMLNNSSSKHIGDTYEAIETYLSEVNGDAVVARDFSHYCSAGYRKNVIANRCVSLIASSAASVDWLLYNKNKVGKQIVKHHRILELLKKPNPSYGGAEFFENIYSYKMLSGNAYILAVKSNYGEVKELYFLRPDRVEVVPGKNTLPAGYIYKVGDVKRYYPVDSVTGQSDILHLKNFHPLDDWYGLSALESAGRSIDLHNQAVEWNHSLLKNGARPCGAFIMPNIDTYLTEDQFERLSLQMRKLYTGSGSAGKPLLLEGGLEWKEMSMSPKDMDYMESKNSSARDIALSLGVPPQLLAIKGDNTYSNMQEARLAFWEETILPLLDHTIDSLNNWLVGRIDRGLELGYDRNAISALSLRQEKEWQRIEAASFMTDAEKRVAVGLASI